MTKEEIEEIPQRLNLLENVLGMFISWSVKELGTEGVDQLLGLLEVKEEKKSN